ncbi:exo-beta-N-acetylmuramidase NamZ domain-containing protein, partial [Streptomyces sp. NPDC048279]|uniref:exo-beta-N-acetylmuramidase NamZ family protein n=1 Tax=Streptomyces sp. NPDC048279 TaxID=3154714 RepID=UPI003439303B
AVVTVKPRDAADKAGIQPGDIITKLGDDVFTASGVDTVVFDIQDVGARFYTYIWTLYDCMEAAQLAGRRFVVLDRPNPVTGRTAQGPVLHREFASFVGRQPIAQAHGMTVAELAKLFNAQFLTSPVELDVVRMTGWRRDRFYDAYGLPWVPPSPNMPTPDTALVYSGTCLFEGTNLSEGRGTTRPFELLGAEGVDARWASAANQLGLPGVRFREAYFTPTFSKFQGKTVGGVQIHVHDRAAYDPVRTGIALLVTAKKVWSDFAWRSDDWIDRLTGSTTVRTMTDAGAGTDEIVGAWRDELAAFRRIRKEFLLYG